MGVLINNQQSRKKIPRKILEQVTQAILDDLGYPEHELSLLITDDFQISLINQEYLNHEGPTNVISFSMHEGEFSKIAPFLLGDIVISADTAEKEAFVAGISFRQRLIELIIHGILHIIGYDHESGDEEKLMEDKAKNLLELSKKILPELIRS